MNMKVKLGNIILQNPIMTASGTFGYGDEFKELVDLNRIGGICVKGTTLEERQGNPTPRILETPGGMLNAIGFQNVGIDRFKKEKYSFLKELKAKTFVNITANTIEEFGILANKLNDIEIGGIEINISCPNIKAGGINMGTDPDMAFKVVKEVKKNTKHHVMVKLTPNVTDIKVIAKAVEDAGADSISLINTLVGMAVDIKTRKPKIKNIIAGLSGPAIKPVALRLVWEVAKTVKIPIVGMGGISNFEDVLEFLIVGATAVQIGTANFYNPRVTMDILDGLEKYMKENEIKDINEIVGSFKI
ncbi:dihydroorotate dehydrogenase [Haliovirga abyssi]|uniref:Dihydroorotate dehydrogenase n=1 Tax=Haliovirga abyssi TaxID=2996794 RepID=A0AAU9DUJ6_9FUSO|nr:dihydroorotate dehydrogenase [Haliovirga abyssi]BDU49651.1 dihydroorotate dehydrogenase [Haliovirga abyssi]